MTLLRRILGLALAGLVSAGCDVSFVAVEDPSARPTTAVFRSAHTERFLITVNLFIPSGGAPATVIAGGTVVPMVDEIEGLRMYRATIEADSLDPTIGLMIEPASGSRLDLDVPLIARGGAARRSDGLLRIPLRFGAGADSVAESWSLVFHDADGARLLTLEAGDVPSPIPRALPATLVPEAAVEGAFRSIQTYTFDIDGDTLPVHVLARVTFSIPVLSSSRGPIEAGGS